MGLRSDKELRDEVGRLCRDHIESLKAQTFGGLTEEELRRQEERLEHIREAFAGFVPALKKDDA